MIRFIPKNAHVSTMRNDMIRAGRAHELTIAAMLFAERVPRQARFAVCRPPGVIAALPRGRA